MRVGHDQPVDETEMTLAMDWDYRDLTWYFWSEKFDGCRAYWDGFQFWTRGGNVIAAPDWFTAALPNGIPLDGEIWCGRGEYIQAMNAVRHGLFTKACKFVAFDTPSQTGDWLKRMEFADLFRNEIVITPARGVVQNRNEASDIAARFIAAGGEGAMFRSPDVFKYERKRTKHLFRIKAKNLVEPWRQEGGRGAKTVGDGADGVLGKARNRHQHQEADGRNQTAARPIVGLDVSLFPFDPEIDWNIRQILGDESVDTRALTKL
jgi:ATP-dependent DNA ligase